MQNSLYQCPITEQVNAHTDTHDATSNQLFNECSPLEDIYQILFSERKVYYQNGWYFTPTVYTPFDILLDRIQNNVEDQELAAAVFEAALFNEQKGEAATTIAQSSEFKQWAHEFFDYQQKLKPPTYDLRLVNADD